MSEWVIVVQNQVANASAMSWRREQATFRCDNDDIDFVLDIHA